MRARSAVVRAEAVAAVPTLRRRARRRLTAQRALRTAHSFALAVCVEAATNRRGLAGNGSRRSLGIGANDHASGLRNRGVRDLAADFAPVQNLRCMASAVRLR